MSINDFTAIEKIAARLYEIQKSHVSLQEQLQTIENTFERNINDSMLQIIDILDMLDMTKSLQTTSDKNDSSLALVMHKIEKRLKEILRRWQVQEITFTDGRILPGKARVLETKEVDYQTPAATIIEICRKGYERGSKIIRPADVITAG